MADFRLTRSGTRCAKNSELLELPEEVLAKVFCFLDEDVSEELDENPLLPLREVCEALQGAVDNNLAALTCFTTVPRQDNAAWLARVQEQIRRMLPKWPELSRLCWHFRLPITDFRILLEAIASTRPDLQELELLPDYDRLSDASNPAGWILAHLSPLTYFRCLQTLTMTNLDSFVLGRELELPALPSVQVLTIKDPCPCILGPLPALQELQVSWSHSPWGHYAVRMPHLAMSTRLACVSLDTVELDHSLQFPASLESLQLHRTIMEEHGSLHLGEELVHLTDLDLNRAGEYEPVDGNSFSGLMRVAKLRSLKLDCASFKGPPDLSFQTSLTSLTLTGVHTRYNLWARTIPFPDLAPLKSLRQLEVAEFEEKESLDLYGLSALKQLSIHSCIELKALNGLEDLTRLQTLSLKGLTFDKSSVNLAALLDLRTLVLERTTFNSDCFVPSSLKRLEYSHFFDIPKQRVQELFSLASDVEIIVKPLRHWDPAENP